MTLHTHDDLLGLPRGRRRVPHRYIESTEMGGRTIYQVERVEVDVELALDTLALEPSAAPGRGR